MKKHTLYTHVEAGKIFWVIEWGWIDGIELSFNLSTREWWLFREAADEKLSKQNAIWLLWRWKKDAKEHIVIPMGLYERYKQTARGKIDGKSN